MEKSRLTSIIKHKNEHTPEESNEYFLKKLNELLLDLESTKHLGRRMHDTLFALRHYNEILQINLLNEETLTEYGNTFDKLLEHINREMLWTASNAFNFFPEFIKVLTTIISYDNLDANTKTKFKEHINKMTELLKNLPNWSKN